MRSWLVKWTHSSSKRRDSVTGWENLASRIRRNSPSRSQRSVRFSPLKGASADFLEDVDNYQGEENDIIVASLTRSNKEGNIGFMSSPERLNVLLSRARMGLILIGNSETFLKSRSGKEVWSKFFDMIKPLGYFYEGLPVRCEQHNDVKNILRSPEEFDKLSPDGGCSEPWFVSLLYPFTMFII